MIMKCFARLVCLVYAMYLLKRHPPKKKNNNDDEGYTLCNKLHWKVSMIFFYDNEQTIMPSQTQFQSASPNLNTLINMPTCLFWITSRLLRLTLGPGFKSWKLIQKGKLFSTDCSLWWFVTNKQTLCLDGRFLLVAFTNSFDYDRK